MERWTVAKITKIVGVTRRGRKSIHVLPGCLPHEARRNIQIIHSIKQAHTEKLFWGTCFACNIGACCSEYSCLWHPRVIPFNGALSFLAVRLMVGALPHLRKYFCQRIWHAYARNLPVDWGEPFPSFHQLISLRFQTCFIRSISSCDQALLGKPNFRDISYSLVQHGFSYKVQPSSIFYFLSALWNIKMLSVDSV